MTEYSEESRKLVEGLGLRYEPVAITLTRKGGPLPDECDRPDNPLRHCQAIIRVRK